MSKKPDSNYHKKLRALAEGKKNTDHVDAATLSMDDVATLIYELETHQIELEIQNEELRSAQEQLISVRDQYAELYDFAPVGYFMLSPKGLILKANFTVLDMLETTRPKLIKQFLSSYIASEDQGNYYDHINSLLISPHKKVSGQLRLSLASGALRYVRMESVLIKSSTSKDDEIRSAFIDITDMYQLLTESEAISKELLQFIDTANAPIFGIDTQGNVNEWNQTAEQITGFSKEEVLGKNLVGTYITEDYRVAVKQVLDDALVGEETSNYEFPLFTKDDKRIMVLLNASTRRNAEGQIAGVLGVGQDITESDALRTETTAIAKELQQFINTANAPIFGIDADGKVNEWNQQAENITGFSKTDVMGRDLVADFITDDYKVSVGRVLSKALNGEQTANFEFPLFNKSGGSVDVLLNSTTRRDATGKVTGVVGVGQDITKLNQVRVEQEKERKEATAQIIQSSKLATKANISKSQFLATMSHEIRTPLNAIIGINDLLQTTELTSEQRGYVQIAEQSGCALREITNNILDFSKIEAGKLELDLQQTDVIGLIDSVILIMGPKAIEKNLELVVVVDYPMPEMVLLDPVRIRQVLLNLVSNAIKFTENGFVQIHLETERNRSNGRSIVVSVIDSGIGIAENIQNTLFDEFTQADLTITRKYGGTGLGLAIASRLVNMSGGNMLCDSVEGEGSCFKFSLNVDAGRLVQFKQVDISCWIFDRSCWVFDRGTKGEVSAKLLYKQLEPLVKQVKMLASWDDIVISEQPYLVFFDESQLVYFSREELEYFVNQKPDNCSLVLLSNNLQEQINKEWSVLFDKQIIKPIAIKFMELFLLNCIGSSQQELDETTLEASSKYECLSGVGLRILLVEDSVVNQLVIKVMLEKKGFFVDVAVNGLVATDRVMFVPYDLILMDLSMPVMGGVEATKIIRKETGLNQNTPIVALTANAFKENKEQCYQAGMSGFLSKPITMTVLYEEITKYFDNQKVDDKSQPLIEETNPDNGKIIDFSILELLKQETSSEVFPNLINAFLEQGEKRVKAIGHSIETLDFELLENEIHALKSESATFGATVLADLTKEINLLCKQDNEKQAFKEAVKIKSQWGYVSEALLKYF
jgi:PAS domain S-box-containing protein